MQIRKQKIYSFKAESTLPIVFENLKKAISQRFLIRTTLLTSQRVEKISGNFIRVPFPCSNVQIFFSFSRQDISFAKYSCLKTSIPS